MSLGSAVDPQAATATPADGPNPIAVPAQGPAGVVSSPPTESDTRGPILGAPVLPLTLAPTGTGSRHSIAGDPDVPPVVTLTPGPTPVSGTAGNLAADLDAAAESEAGAFTSAALGVLRPGPTGVPFNHDIGGPEVPSPALGGVTTLPVAGYHSGIEPPSPARFTAPSSQRAASVGWKTAPAGAPQAASAASSGHPGLIHTSGDMMRGRVTAGPAPTQSVFEEVLRVGSSEHQLPAHVDASVNPSAGPTGSDPQPRASAPAANPKDVHAMARAPFPSPGRALAPVGGKRAVEGTRAVSGSTALGKMTGGSPGDARVSSGVGQKGASPARGQR